MIETSGLLLRPMRADDAAPLLAVFSDPLAMASFGVPPFSDPQMEAWVRRNLDHQAEHGYGLFTVVHKADNLVIGDCGLERMENRGRGVHRAELRSAQRLLEPGVSNRSRDRRARLRI
jgi:RimJ/RimL family protein N-acetyltransferase